MADKIGKFPFWTLQFDKQAKLLTAKDSFLQDVSAANLTDLFIFSHGWNNDRQTAMTLYTGFFTEMGKIVDDAANKIRPNARIGVAGVIWPSILFPGDTAPSTAGGAASLDAMAASATLQSELPKVFDSPEQQQTLQELLDMIKDQSPDNDALIAFRDKLSSLVTKDPAPPAQDDLELKAVTVSSDNDWLRILDQLSVQPAGDGSEGGAADLGSFFGRLWNGAQNALRVATYWEMKNRGGVVGRQGLGPLIGDLHATAPNLNVHLIGHSFGARLVSYALAGLPGSALQGRSPVKSLLLLQGAFSHFAFADALPFDSNRKGDLAGMAARVDGPLLATHSLKDLAVGSAYPAASVVAGQDASDATDLMYRWEGMGHDGAQAVNATSVQLGAVLTQYDIQAGKWINLDGNQVIVNGNPPSGAHSDIIHPETAWAALAGARLGAVAAGHAGGVSS